MNEQTTTSLKTTTHCLVPMNPQAHDRPALSMNTPVETKILFNFFQMSSVTHSNGKKKFNRLPITLVMPILN